MPRKLSTKEARRIAKIRLQKMTPEQLTAHALHMNEKRYGIIKKGGGDTQKGHIADTKAP